MQTAADDASSNLKVNAPRAEKWPHVAGPCSRRELGRRHSHTHFGYILKVNAKLLSVKAKANKETLHILFLKLIL